MLNVNKDLISIALLYIFIFFYVHNNLILKIIIMSLINLHCKLTIFGCCYLSGIIDRFKVWNLMILKLNVYKRELLKFIYEKYCLNFK